MALERCPIRPARPEDAEALIGMMRALATFEGYLPRFRVTARDLHARAFGPGAQCGILVAQGEEGSLPAMPSGSSRRLRTTCARL